jgi:hypothetical protein
MTLRTLIFSLLFVSFFSVALGREMDDIEIDICEPIWEGNAITSKKGAIIKSSYFAFQSNSIQYNISQKKFLGEGDLFFHSSIGTIKGEKIVCDLLQNTIQIEKGIFAYPPWVMEAPSLTIDPRQNVILDKPTLSSDSSERPIWKLKASCVSIQNGVIHGTNVVATFLDIPFLWVPKLVIDPEKIRKSPLKYHVRWGGDQGTRLEATYALYRTQELEAILRTDYRFKRGLGGGLETNYCSYNQQHGFSAINYVAKDSSISDPTLSTRYRFQGIYTGEFPEHATKVKLSYDKLSDKDMAADYYDESLGIEEAKRTELRIQTCTPAWRFNLLTKVQLNSFQSVKQELPTLELIPAPVTLGKTGLLSLSEMRISYLNYDYASNLDVRNFSSSRYELTQKILRLFLLDNLRITPEMGLHALYYSNSPTGTPKELVNFFAQLHAEYPLQRKSSWGMQTLSPYATHVYATEPSTSIDRHYIFDIHDGITNFHYTKFGLYTDLLSCNSCSLDETFFANLYTVGFWDKHRLKEVFPHLHTEISSTFFPNFHLSLGATWHYSKAHFDEWRGKALWTVSTDLALAFEFRNRSDRFFRKVDRENYALDQYHTLDQLLSSSLADQRNTLLFHGYYRFHRNLAIEYQTRIGWGRTDEPAYHESQVDLHMKFASIWHCKLSYQHREDDHRVAFYVNLLEPMKRGCKAIFFQQGD